VCLPSGALMLYPWYQRYGTRVGCT
jgi:hypothetical protein